MTDNDVEFVPGFLHNLASDIFICGKSLNLLRACSPGVCIKSYLSWIYKSQGNQQNYEINKIFSSLENVMAIYLEYIGCFFFYLGIIYCLFLVFMVFNSKKINRFNILFCWSTCFYCKYMFLNGGDTPVFRFNKKICDIL